MINRVHRYWLMMAAAVILMAFPLAGDAGAEDNALQAGEQGHIRLGGVVVAGDLTLRPGTYRIQHVAEGGKHFVRFTRVGWRRDLSAKSPRRVAAVEAEVICEMHMLPEPVGTTRFFITNEGGRSLLTKVEVQGEHMAHLF